MKIHIISKAEKKTTNNGIVYWVLKVSDEDGVEKQGTIFGDTEPIEGTDLEVDEKYNETYRNYNWAPKKEKKQGFVPKPSISSDQQIRVYALQEAVKYVGSPECETIIDPIKIAKDFETYIRTGSGIENNRNANIKYDPI
jgi:hypothetical protein